MATNRNDTRPGEALIGQPIGQPYVTPEWFKLAEEQGAQTLRVGDRVRLCDSTTYLPEPDSHKYGGVAVVVKVNPKNVKVDLAGKTINADKSLLKKTSEEPTPITDTGPALETGALVRVNHDRVRGFTKYPAEQLFVVIADKGDKVNIAKLGGEAGRYWRFQPTALVAVDPADVLK